MDGILMNAQVSSLLANQTPIVYVVDDDISVRESLELLIHEAGWQLIDELNRALSGQPPSGYVAPVHLVTKDNIQYDGGPNNIYDPDNNYQAQYKMIWGK